MPRKSSGLVVDVNDLRGQNYQAHFRARAFVQALPERSLMVSFVAQLERPRLGIFGNTEFAGDRDGLFSFAGALWLLPEPYYQLARHFKLLDPGLLVYWYWDGWADLEAQWSELPEVVHIPLCTTSRVVHICTQAEYDYPSDAGTKRRNR